MNCYTVELMKISKVPKGYGILTSPSEGDIWNTIHRTLAATDKYLYHILEQEWIENPEYAKYNYEGYKDKEDNLRSVPPSFDIPCGDSITKLKIYYETENGAQT